MSSTESNDRAGEVAVYRVVEHELSTQRSWPVQLKPMTYTDARAALLALAAARPELHAPFAATYLAVEVVDPLAEPDPLLVADAVIEMAEARMQVEQLAAILADRIAGGDDPLDLIAGLSYGLVDDAGPLAVAIWAMTAVVMLAERPACTGCVS